MQRLETCCLRELRDSARGCDIRDRPQDLVRSGLLRGGPGCRLGMACPGAVVSVQGGVRADSVWSG